MYPKTYKVDGRTYILSRHAEERALDMDVYPEEIQAALEGGDRYRPTAGTAYANATMYRDGDIGVAVCRNPDGSEVISTVLWATADAWRRAEHAAGREYRGDAWTRRALSGWVPVGR